MPTDAAPLSRRRPPAAGPIAVLAASLVATFGVAAPPAPADFARLRALTAPVESGHQVGRLPLDADVYAHTADGWADLRLFDERDVETPLLVRRAEPVRTTTRLIAFARPAPVTSFRDLGDNRVELTVERDPADPPVAEIRIESQVRDFEKLVTIHGATDGRTWTTLVTDEPIYDYSRFVALRRDRIAVPPGPYTRFRIELSHITERKDSPLVQVARQTRGGDVEVETTAFLRQPFRIERVIFMERRAETRPDRSAPVWQTVAPDALEIAQDPQHRQTLVTLATGRRPVTRLTLETPDENFSRRARVEAWQAGPPAGWRPVGAGDLRVIRVGRIHDRALELEFPETRAERLRIVIANEDSPPVTIAGVTLREIAYEALFFPKAGRAYRLAYGAPDLAAPRYDIAAVLAGAPSADADQWTAAPPTGAAAASRPRARIPARTWLVTALVAMAALLLGIIVRLARRVNLAGE